MTNTTKITKEFSELLENLKPDKWNLKIKNRTIKEIIAHLVGWEKEAVEQLDKVWKSKQKPWFLKTDNFDEFNKESINYYKNYSPKELINEWKKYQKLLDNKINEIGEKNLRAEPELFNWVFDKGEENHYLEHLNEIKGVLEK